MASVGRAAGGSSISGRVLHKESGVGIADLLIDLFDLDGWGDPEEGAARSSSDVRLPDLETLYRRGERIGSVVTDADGRFALEVGAAELAATGQKERRPDLALVVLAPDEPGSSLGKRMLYSSTEVRLNAGSREAYVVRLPTELLAEKAIPVPGGAKQSVEMVTRKVEAYVSESRAVAEFNAGVATYRGAVVEADSEAREAFKSAFKDRLRANLGAAPIRGTVAKPGDDLAVLNQRLADAALGRANALVAPEGGRGVPVSLFLTAEDRERLGPLFEGATGDFVDIDGEALAGALVDRSGADNPGTLLIRNNPIASFCETVSAEERCAKEHLGLTSSGDGAAGEDSPPDALDLDNASLPGLLGKLVNTMPTTDGALAPTSKRADRREVEKAVDEFSLARGPAEVPAFYDFHSLQVAFDHVWRQLFDEAVPELAYTADTLGKSKLGIASVVSALLRDGRLPIGGFFASIQVEVPATVARFFDITKDEYNEMSFAHREQLDALARSISLRPANTVHDLRLIQSLTEQGERLIDAVRHDDFYTLHRTLRDLHARLSGKYEFTVFAADKDRHSVNFGVLNTYRQKWTPLQYQAGRLVRTVPLSPKEERKYAVRITQREKRSTKEAKKNNSSITDERTSTSRVEAEIIKKAQNKTSFGITAEGEFDIGISEGKSTTTFGVEALSESAQTRRDFRESVAKAVRDYKAETSTEVVLESDDTFDSTESGTIVNPNDELSVTYLFYELQKRYRISEELYRVMPVVLVAQEVPSPEQITPAWVLSHDWILNRVLLDDSFRPTLRYLANNSVGDDFSLRELRKNLRQQRNLVETLRIEFSAASIEADNRYKALERAIQSRIDEEHEERTDGLGHDIWDFFGGGGQDPEAAKARELAAKDAQQYALEKAEKAAAALREEMNTLHALTADYNRTLRARLDEETKVQRLLVHVRNNIFYYMQAIWSMEPPDQRYLRLYEVPVPVLETESRSYSVRVTPEEDIFAPFREPGTQKHKAFLHARLKHMPQGGFATKPLAEVADLDALLGFRGNYMIFPLREHNALTELMAAPYVDAAFGAMDPDELSQVSLEEYSKYVCCLHEKLSAEDFQTMKPALEAWLEKLLASPLRNGDEVVVPTGSLFIENLVGKNAILEDYKLMHRELDVLKTDQEVRKAALENLRLAARLLNAERDDPDVDRKIVVEGGDAVSPSIDVGDV